MKNKNNRFSFVKLKLPPDLKAMLSVSDIYSNKSIQVLKRIDDLKQDFSLKKLEKEIVSFAVTTRKKSGMAYLNFTKHSDVLQFSKVQQDYINNRAQLLIAGREILKFKLGVAQYRMRLRSYLSKHTDIPDLRKMSIAKISAFWQSLLFPVEEFYMEIEYLEEVYEATLSVLDQQGYAISSLVKTAELLNRETLV